MEELKVRNIGSKSCGGSTSGTQDPALDWIAKGTTGDTDYPVDACPRYVHGGAQINTIQVNTAITGSPTCTLGAVNATTGNFSGAITATEVTAGGVTLTSRKAFDIQHPSKEGWRLRHICLEGPESAVYYRGKLKDTNIIELPDYWEGLVDSETITVSLTQIGYSQDLIVEEIEDAKRIVIKSGTGRGIHCYFLVHAERIDGEKLIVEYEGDQYPGDNSQYSINK